MKHFTGKATFLIMATALLLLTACDPYQKVLKSSNLELKYTKAKEYYNKGDYYKALPLFEELISVYKGSKNTEELYYYFAYSYFGQGDYLVSAYHFRNLATTYPKGLYAEEANYMVAQSYYMLSPVFNLDQTYTQKSIDAYQFFINTYPDSKRVDEANDLIDKMRRKLELKAYSNAQLYYNIQAYKAASAAFTNLLKDFPDTPDREKVQFMIIKSYFLWAENSIAEKKEERYNLAIKTYQNFTEKYIESKFLKEAERIHAASVENLNKLNDNEKK